MSDGLMLDKSLLSVRVSIIMLPSLFSMKVTPPWREMPCTLSRPGVDKLSLWAAGLPRIVPLLLKVMMWPEALFVDTSPRSVGVMSDIEVRSEVTEVPLQPESIRAGGIFDVFVEA